MSEYITKIRTASGDLQIDYNALANLPQNMASQEYVNTSIASFSNPNLLTNGDFRNPVNQRGQTSYTIPDSTYTIDRWKVLSNAGTLSVNDGYIKLSSDSSTSSYFIQKTENIPVDDYITVSINVKSLTGTLNVYIAGASQEECFSIYSAGVATYTTSVKFTDFMQLNIEAINDATVELYWAKVEQGSIATPFVSRLYDEELILCQRYYEERTLVFFPLGGSTPSSNYVAVNGGQHFVEMRGVPTVAIGTLYNYTGADSGATVSSNTCTAKSLRAINLSASNSNYMLRAAVTFDAEIY